ncbi:hypothetical protein CONCODRAFT_12501 [Conidiobolus coronatus NRRL 28638]|uniref:Svf1-like C-terminal domain-containing protein n=1 Tax=Conidiobolus coronatus (strain ATCC 28846 / CBS 209.66 / NRRL 28638) TaxID=796925 RepID=A0A137NSX7_CONC2|nr:hypothetical protein CONCODRAFT_12501 [Conidiobolus coronatus NRRL 28638]|eukprot:KXN65812.1 hypothetical protein CONCODRAFT_12501 [Conidiobolus coronatus NRRL 28638]
MRAIHAKGFEVADNSVSTNNLYPTTPKDFRFWSESDQAYDLDNHFIYVNDKQWLRLVFTGAQFMYYNIVNLSVQYNDVENPNNTFQKTYDCNYHTMIRKNNSLAIETSCMDFSYSINNNNIFKKIKLKILNEVEGEFELTSIDKGIKAWNDKGRFIQNNKNVFMDQVFLAFKGIKGSAKINQTYDLAFNDNSAAVMNHETMNVLPSSFYSRLNSHYFVAGDYQVFSFQFYPYNGQNNPKNNGGYGYAFAYKGNELVLASNDMEYKITDGKKDPDSGYPLADALEFYVKDTTKSELVNEDDRNLNLSFKFGALSTYPWYYVWIVKFAVGNPWTYNYLFRGHINVASAGNSNKVDGNVICAKGFEVPDYNVTTNSLFPTNPNDFKFWSEWEQAYDIDNHIIWVNDNHWLKLTLTGAEFMRFGIVSLSVQYNLADNSDYSYRKTFDCSYYTMIRKNDSLTIESSCMDFSYSIREFEMASIGKGVKAWNDKGRFNQKNSDKYMDQVILAFKGIKGSATIDGTHKINFTDNSAAVMAHETMNVLPTDFFNRGNTYYVVAEDYQIFVFQFYPTNGQTNPKNNGGYGYTVVYKGNELILASSDMNYELTDGKTDPKSGYPFSTALKFNAQDNEKGIKVSQKDNDLKLSYSVGALENYPFYYSWFVKMIVGNPWIYNYLAQGNVIIEDSNNSINVVGDVFIMNEFYNKD